MTDKQLIKTALQFTKGMGIKSAGYIYKKCSEVVFAWGNFKQAQGRGWKVKKCFPNPLCLGKNKNGTPKHPLYMK